MRWPRGKWNGRRIVGVRVTVVVDVTAWGLQAANRYGDLWWIGPVRIRPEWAYDAGDRP